MSHRVMLLGVAHPNTPDYVTQIRMTPGVEVGWVCCDSQSHVDRILDRTDAVHLTDLSQMPEPTAVNAVLILSETHNHLNLVDQVASLDRPVFVECPRGPDAAMARAVAARLRAMGGRFHTGHFLRSDETLCEVRQAVQDGALGTVLQVHLRIGHDGSFARWLDQDGWIVDPRQAGFGGFGERAVHGFDLIRWMLGDIDRVCALIGRHGGQTIDTHGSVVFALASGAQGLLESGWIDSRDLFELRVTGTGGILDVTDGAAELITRTTEGAFPQKILFGDLSLDPRDGVVPFLRQLTGERAAPPVTVDEALAAVLAVDACYRSAERGGWVRVAETGP